MLDLQLLPATLSLRSRDLAPLNALIARMRTCARAYEPDCAVSLIVPASDLRPFMQQDDDLLALVIDLPARLRRYIPDWQQCTPEPDRYEGTWQELFTCLRLHTTTGASLCVDVECLADSMLNEQWGRPSMLVCLACEDEVALSLLDSAMLTRPDFTSKLRDMYITTAEDRSNLRYSVRKEYREIDVIARPQGREERPHVVPWVLGLNEVRTAALLA